MQSQRLGRGGQLLHQYLLLPIGGLARNRSSLPRMTQLFGGQTQCNRTPTPNPFSRAVDILSREQDAS